jgi:hypothetical protein
MLCLGFVAVYGALATDGEEAPEGAVNVTINNIDEGPIYLHKDFPVTIDVACGCNEPGHDLQLNTWHPGQPYLDGYFTTIRDMELLCNYTDSHFIIQGYTQHRFVYSSIDDNMWGLCSAAPGSWHGEDRDLLILVEIDFDIGTRCDGNDDTELDPGLFLILNNDDDDNDGVPDYMDTDGVTGEDDAAFLTLDITPDNLPLSHSVRLWWDPAINDRFRLFKNEDLTEQVFGNGEDYITWDVDEFEDPIVLYIDGIYPSAVQAAQCVHSILYCSPGTGDSDLIYFTVVGAWITDPWYTAIKPIQAQTNFNSFTGPHAPDEGNYLWSIYSCPTSASYTFSNTTTDTPALQATTPGLYKTKLEYTYNDLTAEDISDEVWYVGIDKLQWRVGTDAYANVTGTLYIPRYQTAYFVALKNPCNAPDWPDDQPVWSGTSGVEGSGVETASWCVDTGSHTVIASCGNSSATATIIGVDIKITEPTGTWYSYLYPLEFEAEATPSGGTYSWEVIYCWPEEAEYDLEDADTATPTLNAYDEATFRLKVEYTVGGCTVTELSDYILLN